MMNFMKTIQISKLLELLTDKVAIQACIIGILVIPFASYSISIMGITLAMYAIRFSND